MYVVLNMYVIFAKISVLKKVKVNHALIIFKLRCKKIRIIMVGEKEPDKCTHRTRTHCIITDISQAALTSVLFIYGAYCLAQASGVHS